MYRKGSDEDIFAELVFCLLTPQAKARVCWETVERLCERGLLLKGGCSSLSPELNRVRFKNNKARNIVEARKLFSRSGVLRLKERLDSFGDAREAREWLVRHVRGMGYKEAGHFLRNIGKGEDLAILDRHILRNLVLLGALEEVPTSLTPNRYQGIEERMMALSREVGIPMDHLDLLLWCKETGEVFK